MCVCIRVHVYAGLMVLFQDGSDEHQQERFPGDGRDRQVLCPLLCTH